MSVTDYPEFERPWDDEHIAELEAERDEAERLHEEACEECSRALDWLEHESLPGVADAIDVLSRLALTPWPPPEPIAGGLLPSPCLAIPPHAEGECSCYDVYASTAGDEGAS